ncbi:MAG: 2-polyprenylphenol 6-hydroxylase [Pseudomonadota bacterium]
MSFFSNVWRLVRTGSTFERTGALSVAMEAMGAPPPLRVAAKALLWPFQWLGLKGDPALPPVVRAITALGPSYVKFGQILSTRPDVTGDELAGQLRILQDKLAPFPMDAARREVALELGCPVEEVFSEFSPPIAAASIAQVHRARVRDSGREVAVKIRRPDIAKAFKRDIDAFYFVAGFIEFFVPATRRLKPKQVVAHFDSVVQGELDFRMEAAAAAEYGALVADDEGFSVPAVLWDLSASRVMTTEWMGGTNMGDIDALKARGIDLPDMAKRIIQTFLNHALRDGFFHGDMHQGNLKVGPTGDLVAFDFGIMGRIDAYTRKVYAEILIGFLRKDYRRVAEVHFEAGYVPADKDVDAFAQALRSVAEPIFGQDASRISMARLLGHLFDVTERFGMETRTELLLLQRTMVVVEGVSRSLDPTMNMWTVSKPVVEGYIRDNIGPRAVARDLAETVRILSRFGPLLPRMAEDALIRANATPVPEPHTRSVPGWIWALVGAVLGALIAAGLDRLG